MSSSSHFSDSTLLSKTLSPVALAELARERSAAGALGSELTGRLKEIARTPHLLVGCDYDGTLAPIQDKPSQALPTPEAVVALRALAALPNTDVAVISGRPLRDLAAVSRLPHEVHLVGSHGSEFDIGFVDQLGPRQSKALKALDQQLTKLVRKVDGAFLERKPSAIAVHVRMADPAEARKVVEATKRIAEELGVFRTKGKKVVDMSVVKTSKSKALRAIRGDVGASAALYLGDDVADERAFKSLRGPDLGVKVGPGESAAPFRLGSQEQVPLLLALLFEMRRAWLFGEDAVPLERHTLIGNGVSTALLTPDATVCWMTHPLPDSASLFAHILGGEPAGHFSVGPQDGSPVLAQRYRDHTMVVDTRWAEVGVTDYFHEATDGITDLVRVLHGTGKARITYAPRPDYAGANSSLEQVGNALNLVGVPETVRLHFTPGVEFTIEQDGKGATATAVVDLSAGDVVLNLRCGDTSGAVPDLSQEKQWRARVEAGSRGWVESLEVPDVKPTLTARSALTLRALCHTPTGGVLAAPTTSLPEGIGGVRNWDYRYCWLRDGSMTVRTLVDLGATEEAEGFLRWLSNVLAESPGAQWLHPLYPVRGLTLPTEAVLEFLPGYAGSRPVRIGNAADHQVQLDVFGPVADLIDGLSERTGELTDFQWDLLGQMVEAVQARWHEPDHGIWEARMAPRHHVYTRTMCWMTVDRALRAARRHGRSVPEGWEATAEAIRSDVLQNGWNEEANAFTVAYGSTDSDAAVLHVGLSGLLDADDPRFAATVAAVERELRVGPTVFRYRYDDGLPGLEGGFHICTTWLIEAYLLVGRVEDARELFGTLVALCGPTGLLPEEYDPAAEMHLGNHPQAYSHLGFIRCAQRLARV